MRFNDDPTEETYYDKTLEQVLEKDGEVYRYHRSYKEYLWEGVYATNHVYKRKRDGRLFEIDDILEDDEN